MDALEQLISQMTDEEVASGIEKAKADLLVVQKKDEAEVVFSAGVLLVREQARRRNLLVEELRRALA